MVDVGYRLTDELEEFCREPEAVSGGVEERVGVKGCLGVG